MKQNNYEHIAIFDANVSNVTAQRLRSKQQQNKQHRLWTYSSVAAVSALALLSSAIILPFMKQHELDSEVYAVDETKIVATEQVRQATTTQVVNSKLSDNNNLFKYYGSEIEHRSNAEQEQALLYLLHKTKQRENQREEVLKVKEVEWNNNIKFVPNQQQQSAGKNQKSNQANANRQVKTSVTEPTVAATSAMPIRTQAVASTTEPKATFKQVLRVQGLERVAKTANKDVAESEVDEFATELTDKELMYYIVMAETGFSDSDSISLVAQIIVNRTKVFGESLRSVLTAPNQFSCYEDGSYKQNAPTQRVKQICDAALAGAPMGNYILPRDTIFYCTVNYYLTKPDFFTSLKRILTHNTQIFFARSDSSSSPMDDWQAPELEDEKEETHADAQPATKEATEVEATQVIENE